MAFGQYDVTVQQPQQSEQVTAEAVTLRNTPARPQTHLVDLVHHFLYIRKEQLVDHWRYRAVSIGSVVHCRLATADREGFADVHAWDQCSRVHPWISAVRVGIPLGRRARCPPFIHAHFIIPAAWDWSGGRQITRSSGCQRPLRPAQNSHPRCKSVVPAGLPRIERDESVSPRAASNSTVSFIYQPHWFHDRHVIGGLAAMPFDPACAIWLSSPGRPASSSVARSAAAAAAGGTSGRDGDDLGMWWELARTTSGTRLRTFAGLGTCACSSPFAAP